MAHEEETKALAIFAIEPLPDTKERVRVFFTTQRSDESRPIWRRDRFGRAILGSLTTRSAYCELIQGWQNKALYVVYQLIQGCAQETKDEKGQTTSLFLNRSLPTKAHWLARLLTYNSEIMIAGFDDEPVPVKYDVFIQDAPEVDEETLNSIWHKDPDVSASF